MSDLTKELYDALRMVLPLAEAYLRGAPSHPDNAILETARSALREARDALAVASNVARSNDRKP